MAHTNQVIASLELSEADKAAAIDLRPFMDPSPYVVNELMPLRRVYRLFNEIGVRHLTVVDCREQVVGIITRKDILPEIIEHRVMAVYVGIGFLVRINAVRSTLGKKMAMAPPWGLSTPRAPKDFSNISKK